MKCLVNIKQGFDRPVSITELLPGLWLPLQAFVITCNVHTFFILYYIMKLFSVLLNETIYILFNQSLLHNAF